MVNIFPIYSKKLDRWDLWFSHPPIINDKAIYIVSVILFSSVAQSCPTLCSPMDCSMPGFPVHHQLPELVQTPSSLPSNHFILCRPLLFLPSIFPSIRVFCNDSFLHIRWRKYWSFSFSITPSNEYSALIPFRIDWFDLAVEGTLKSFLQYHSLKASILQHSTFFIAQLSHPYIVLEKWSFD